MKQQDPIHPIIEAPHTYDIVEFKYVVAQNFEEESYIDLTLQKGEIKRFLRFYKPTKLKIEEGFPWPTRGMEILDVKERQMTDIGVWVHDFESSNGAITFYAKNVIDLNEQ